MRVIRVGFILSLLAFALPAHAQFFTVSNSCVTADVSSNGLGLIRIFAGGPSDNRQHSLSHEAFFSFLTVEINNNTFYTNNTNIQTGNFPTNPKAYLNNGRTTVIKDTIETVWQPEGANAFDIVQDVYPVLLGDPLISGVSGQIVTKISIRNHENVFIPAQAQYLLDIDVSTPRNADDNAPITTRAGIITGAWTNFPNSNFQDIPPYFIATMDSLNNKNFPGWDGVGGMGIGYLTDDLAPEPMGLGIQPQVHQLSFVDLPTVVSSPGIVWGVPTSPSSTVTDEAMLIMWDPSGVDPNDDSTKPELGRFSYGTPACMSMNLGNLDEMVLHADVHSVWDGKSNYIPNHFPVDAIVWNPGSTEANPVNATQTITNDQTGGGVGPIIITAPPPVPAPNAAQTQTHSTTPLAIQPQTSGYATWEDSVTTGYMVASGTDSVYDIQVSLAAGGVAKPIFILTGSTCPVAVDGEQKDVTPPRFTPWEPVGKQNRCGNYTKYSDSVFDNNPADFDLGLQSISWTVEVNGVSTPSAVKVDTQSHPSCFSTGKLWITVTQIDTLHSECVYFTFTDCNSNVSHDTLCFNSCPLPIPHDSLSPRIRLIGESDFNNPTDSSCSFKCSEWVVTDSVNLVPFGGLQRDGGLKSIIDTLAQNMTFTLLHPVTLGLQEDTFTVCVQDSMQNGSITIIARDSAGNPATMETITYCTDPDTRRPVITAPFQPPTHTWPVTVTDDSAWDRGVDSVVLHLSTNCYPVANPALFRVDSVDTTKWVIHPNSSCPSTLNFDVAIRDTFLLSCIFEINAWDCAGNVDTFGTSCVSALVDKFCPTDSIKLIGLSGEQIKSGDTIMVIVSDFHIINGNDTIRFDEGIDSIWFPSWRNVTMVYHGVPSMPHAIHEPDTGTFPRLFTLQDTVFFFVTNVLDSSVDSLCIRAIDGDSNQLCIFQDCWSGPIAQDLTVPQVTVNSGPCDFINVTVTDSAVRDRGIASIWLVDSTNFKPLNLAENGAKTASFGLPVVDSTQSAKGKLFVGDVFGQKVGQPVETIHTDSLDVWDYKQDAAVKGIGVVWQKLTTFPHSFKVPVHFVKNDSMPLGTKTISEFQFTFNLTGTPNLSFTGTANGTLPAGWNISVAPVPPAAGPYMVTGMGPVLGGGNITDTLCYLTFTANQPVGVESAQIEIESDACGADIVYNGGNDFDTVYPNVSIALPAPTGRMTGGTIVLMDSCSTVIGVNNFSPTELSIDPVTPNPISAATTVTYRIPDNGTNGAPVRMELYNMLGERLKTVVDQTLTQGDYTVPLDLSNLSAGMYFLRLESAGKICSQQVIVSR